MNLFFHSSALLYFLINPHSYTLFCYLHPYADLISYTLDLSKLYGISQLSSTNSIFLCFITLLLWNTLDLTFYFSFIYFFFWFYFSFSFSFRTIKKTHDKEVTWHVTWYDVISLELDGRVWKMMSGHLKYTWWPWVGHEAGMRMKHGHKGRVIY